MDGKPVKSNVELLAEVLRKGKFFIPRYQRPYAWHPEHVKSLLDDFADCIAHRREHYFLGAIMLVSGREDGRQEINDGQQRIATFLLICAYLCRHFHECGYSRGEGESLRVLFHLKEGHDKTLTAADELEPRIVLSTNDKATFEALTCGHSPRKNGGMNGAWSVINEFFLRPEYASPETKKQFFNFLLNSVEVAWIKFEQAADPIAVFETVNARGKSLEQIQLACAYFYSCLQGDEVRSGRIQEQIDGVRTNLKGDEKQFLDYARCAGQCRYGHLSSDRFCRDIKRSISALAIARRSAEVCEFVRQLSQQHKIRIFQNLTHAHTDNEMLTQLTRDARAGRQHRKIADYLKDLRKYSVSHSILFALLCKYADVADAKQKKESAKFAHTAGKLLASFFQRAAHSYPGAFAPSHYEQGVAQLAMSVAGGRCRTPKDFLEALRILDKKAHIISDLQYRGRMESIAFSSNIPVAKYVLARINEHLQREFAVIADRSTVEHILPKGKKHLGGWDFTDEEYALYVHRLGNLTLLAPKDNKPGDADNANFGVKCPIYRESAYDGINKELAKFPRWDVKSLEERQKKLAKLAAAVWNFRTG